MARRKKSGAGGGIGALFVGLLVLLAAIPREVWIGIGVLAAVGVGIYLYLKSKDNAQAAQRSLLVRLLLFFVPLLLFLVPRVAHPLC